MLCLLLDMAKGAVPVFLASKSLGTEELLFAVVMTAPVLGHAYSPYEQFSGGKCIATVFGVWIALFSVTYMGWMLAGLYILFSTIVRIPSHRLRSRIVFSLFALLAVPVLLFQGHFAIAIGGFAISVLPIIKHKKRAEKPLPVQKCEN